MIKVVVIHGQSHKGSTYHIAHNLALKISEDITEFFLPKDFGEFCLGCNSCFYYSEERCPHHKKLSPITKALDEADVIILASPVYVMHASGPMKAFLDHYGYRWMIHRPSEHMFKKQGVCISTAAGSGTKSTNKDMADSLFFWGVAKTYKFGVNVAAVNWQSVNEKKKNAIDKSIDQLAKKIIRNNGKVKPNLKTRITFSFMRLIQKKGILPTDALYWKEKGWLNKDRPWK